MIHPVKGFTIVREAEVDGFQEFSCFFHDPANVGSLISSSSAFSKTSLNIWKFTVLILLKPGLENFENYFSSVWDECNCAVVWAIFGEQEERPHVQGAVAARVPEGLEELFQILKDDAVKVLHSICQQIWKTQQWPQDWKKSVFILIPKKGNAKRMLKPLHNWTHFTR